MAKSHVPQKTINIKSYENNYVRVFSQDDQKAYIGKSHTIHVSAGLLGLTQVKVL